MEPASDTPVFAPTSTGQALSTTGEGRTPVGSAVDSVRGRAGHLQAQLADALDSGASVIRERATSLSAAAHADASGGSTSPVIERFSPQVLAQGELAANVMERGATWLRENDFSDLEARLVSELKQNPMRTLGIAAVVGFLVAGRRR